MLRILGAKHLGDSPRPSARPNATNSVVVAVDHQRDPAGLLDIAYTFQRATGLLWFFVNGDEEALTVVGVADRDHMRLTRRVGGGQMCDAAASMKARSRSSGSAAHAISPQSVA